MGLKRTQFARGTRSKVRRIKVKGKTKTPTIYVKSTVCWFASTLTWTVPIRLKSPNALVHYRTQGKINDKIGRELMVHMPKEIKHVTLPCQITFTRIAPRRLDSDNNTFAFKYCRDYLCGHLRPGLRAGRADTEEFFKFEYSQETAGKGEYGIKISIKNLANINDEC